MNQEQLAEQLNGNEYGSEISKELKALAKDNGLVVVFGYSDDNMEFLLTKRHSCRAVKRTSAESPPGRPHNQSFKHSILALLPQEK